MNEQEHVERMSQLATAHAGASASQVTLIGSLDGSSGECRVVDEHNLANMAGRGWKPVATWREYVLPTSCSPYDQNIMNKLGMWRTLFLMAQPADETLAEAQSALDRATSSANDEHHKRTIAEQEIEKLKEQVKKEQAESERVRGLLSTERKERREMDDSLRKYERSLGKVREQLGTLKYKEIVGE